MSVTCAACCHRILLLSQDQNASLARQGLSGEPHRSPTRCRQDHRVPRGRWTASSLRAPGCLNSCEYRTDTPFFGVEGHSALQSRRTNAMPFDWIQAPSSHQRHQLMKIRIPIFTREPISSRITFLSKDRREWLIAASAIVAGREPAKTASGFAVSWLGRRRHEVSILIAGVGGGRYLGELPRAERSR